jgi:hypothetical protein
MPENNGYDFVITLRNTITSITAGEFLHNSQVALTSTQQNREKNSQA